MGFPSPTSLCRKRRDKDKSRFHPYVLRNRRVLLGGSFGVVLCRLRCCIRSGPNLPAGSSSRYESAKTTLCDKDAIEPRLIDAVANRDASLDGTRAGLSDETQQKLRNRALCRRRMIPDPLIQFQFTNDSAHSSPCLHHRHRWYTSGTSLELDRLASTTVSVLPCER
ncbi:hypothetical protein SMC7_06025 [Candidatus Cryosericum terrychapinii]|uniref:Uncharacterized protein n=1 Tax=Candidatus Cryosericum terrychapinii TaxID=2290919 RepID=A0A398CWS9_9BACT|nr:hypothetical protein SMC7_06025 [Candidatus Cryosericum terrychapinii]